MEIKFDKYQGTGNDFIMIDDRNSSFPSSDFSLINKMCDRKFGIGGDGLILLQEAKGYDFRMKYFNADGKEGSMCGNGGRCIIAFAKSLDIINDKTEFIAVDGLHDGKVLENDWVNLKMSDVDKIAAYKNDWVLDTGSPHYIRFVNDINKINVFREGRLIRYSDDFKIKGINVNFVEFIDGKLHVHTYERGVEDETLSCGTGVTAAAISYLRNKNGNQKINIISKGGELSVSMLIENKTFKNIWLSGPANKVFSGSIIY